MSEQFFTKYEVPEIFGGSVAAPPNDSNTESVEYIPASLHDVQKEYETNFGKLLAYARVLTPSIMNAEDLVQQAFINTVDQIKRGHPIHTETLHAYIKQSIRNISITQYQHDSIQPKKYLVEEMQTSPDALAQLSLEKQAVANAIASLKGAQRAVIVMHYFEKMKVDEIARDLSLSPSTVKTHLQRGRKHIAESIMFDELFRKDES